MTKTLLNELACFCVAQLHVPGRDGGGNLGAGTSTKVPGRLEVAGRLPAGALQRGAVVEQSARAVLVHRPLAVR